MSKCTVASNLRMLNKPCRVPINRYRVCQNTRRYNRGLSAGILKFGRQPTDVSLPHCPSALVRSETERLLLLVQHVFFVVLKQLRIGVERVRTILQVGSRG